MLVKCSECHEMQAWKGKGVPPLRATACDKCGLPALRKLTPAEERARRQAYLDAMPPRAPVVVASQISPPTPAPQKRQAAALERIAAALEALAPTPIERLTRIRDASGNEHTERSLVPVSLGDVLSRLAALAKGWAA